MDPARYNALQTESRALQQQLHEQIYDMSRENMKNLRDHLASKLGTGNKGSISGQLVKILDINLQLHPERAAATPAVGQFSKRGVSTPDLDLQTTAKRRKVRKGTQSCWQCKRRKIKCTFAKEGAKKCDGCRGRNTACVSQEVEEDAGLAGVDQGPSTSTDASLDSVQGPELRQLLDTPREGRFLQSLQVDHNKTIHDCLVYTVKQYWPVEEFRSVMLDTGIGGTILSHGTVCIPYNKWAGWRDSMKAEMQAIQLSHTQSKRNPVLFARMVLIIAIVMQGAPTEQWDAHLVPEHPWPNLTSIRFKRAMFGLFDAAVKFVTSNDNLLHSIEGIELLMMESMFENNNGNLRRAWLVNRKAISTAQLLGLHEGRKNPHMAIEQSAWARIDPSFMWHRLLATDRYLCLVLGLPQAVDLVNDDSFVFIRNKGWSDFDKAERASIEIAGRILNRNAKQRHNVNETTTIDLLLRQSGERMNSEWWEIGAETSAIDRDDDTALNRTLTSMSQLTHHHLVIQTHLPFVLSTDSGHEYSKTVIANASRSALTVYKAFRGGNLGSTYCRGIDFIALIASVVLCIVHMEVRQQVCPNALDGILPTTKALRHQRHSDIALIRKIHALLQNIVDQHDDAIAKQICMIIKPLLDVEKEAESGDYYYKIMESWDGDRSRTGYVSCTLKTCGGLEITVPHLGHVRLEKIPGRAHLADGVTINTGIEPIDLYTPEEIDVNQQQGSAAALLGPDEWSLHGADFALFDGLGADWLRTPDSP